MPHSKHTTLTMMLLVWCLTRCHFSLRDFLHVVDLFSVAQRLTIMDADVSHLLARIDRTNMSADEKKLPQELQTQILQEALRRSVARANANFRCAVPFFFRDRNA